MKCPLSSYVKVVARGETDFDWKDCLKEECACWSIRPRVCVILDIDHMLHELWSELHAIAGLLGQRE